MVKMSIREKFLEHKMFWLILFVGLILRLLFIEFQGLSNDELSAWYRTRYPMGETFWKLGVREGDMHPAFYQVLLWVWVRVFGDSDFSIRMTSLIFFGLNLGLLYKISCSFFSKYTGQIIAVLYSSLGFLIVNTTTARPYNSGVFFLLVIFYLILFLKERKESFGILRTLFLSLAFFGAMTSHYFAFLSAGILGVVALFYVQGESRKTLFISGISALLLFLGLHLKITLVQLSQGGLGWLGKPSIWWFFDFSKLVLQDSIPVLLFVVLLMIFIKRGCTHANSHQGFSLWVFISISLVAYLISIFYTPILRELVFQFILPFLLFAWLGTITIVGTAKEKRPYRKFLPVLLLVFLSLHSVFVYNLFQPKHYGVFRELAENQKELEEEFGRDKITYAQNTNNFDYLNYYLKDSNSSEEIKDWASADAVYQLNDRVKKSETPYFLYNWTNNYHVPMYVECIRREYPNLLRREEFFNSGIYFFSKESKGRLTSKKELLQINYNQGGIFEGNEFFNEKRLTIGELRKQVGAKDYLLLETSGKVPHAHSFYLVIEAVDKNGQSILKEGQPFYYCAFNQQQLNPTSDNKTMFSAFSIPKELKNDDEMKIYCWNPEKDTILLSKLKLYAIH